MDGHNEKLTEQILLSTSKSSTSKLEATGSRDEVKKQLAEMGYEQELKRSLSMISILGLSFAIIATPFVLLDTEGTNSRPFPPASTLV